MKKMRDSTNMDLIVTLANPKSTFSSQISIYVEEAITK